MATRETECFSAAVLKTAKAIAGPSDRLSAELLREKDVAVCPAVRLTLWLSRTAPSSLCVFPPLVFFLEVIDKVC
jgi:hypothetical protein